MTVTASARIITRAPARALAALLRALAPLLRALRSLAYGRASWPAYAIAIATAAVAWMAWCACSRDGFDDEDAEQELSCKHPRGGEADVRNGKVCHDGKWKRLRTEEGGEPGAGSRFCSTEGARNGHGLKCFQGKWRTKAIIRHLKDSARKKLGVGNDDKGCPGNRLRYNNGDGSFRCITNQQCAGMYAVAKQGGNGWWKCECPDNSHWDGSACQCNSNYDRDGNTNECNQHQTFSNS
jgi:hypothetical protein